MVKRRVSSARARRAAASEPSIVRYNVTPTERKRVQRLPRLRHRPDADIDFSDIPESTPEELAAFRRPSRVGRPPIGEEKRQPIALRMDRHVLETLRKEATRRGVGYQTLINDLLASAAIRFDQRRS